MLTSEDAKSTFLQRAFCGLFESKKHQRVTFFFGRGGSRSAGVTLREWLFASADVKFV
jgi:hypothetical protein